MVAKAGGGGGGSSSSMDPTFNVDVDIVVSSSSSGTPIKIIPCDSKGFISSPIIESTLYNCQK